MSEFWQGIIEKLQEIFDPTTLGTQLADYASRFIVGLIVFLVSYLIWRIVRLLIRPGLERYGLDETSTGFVMTIVKYTILIIGAVNALATAGIDTAGILTSLGIAGLTIGFAARDAFSNVISGILIFLDRPFVVGDLVEIDEHYGTVHEITLRSTRIITSDGKMLAVPNADIINKTVASYTNFPHLRLDIEATVGVDEDLNHVREVLLAQVAGDAAFLAQPAPRVIVTQLNDYNVAVELQAWLEKERDHVEQRSALRERVFNALRAAGVDMPFETLQLMPVEVRSG